MQHIAQHNLAEINFVAFVKETNIQFVFSFFNTF